MSEIEVALKAYKISTKLGFEYYVQLPPNTTYATLGKWPNFSRGVMWKIIIIHLSSLPMIGLNKTMHVMCKTQ